MPKITDFNHNLNQEALQTILKEYQFAITPEMAKLIPKNPENNPIALQFLPDIRELNIDEHELIDPIGDKVHSPLPTLIHRYENRVLWKINQTCAVYCRFCFRKEQIGKKGKALPQTEREEALLYLQNHSEIEEVILSGGDPLFISPKRLATFVLPLKKIDHIRRIRIHSRIPVVSPEMINDELFNVFADLPQSKHLVIHINHSMELTEQAKSALKLLRQNDFNLYSQSVLLKGINNNAETLAQLMNNLLDNGVKPYYLHHLDLARGTQHFRVSLDEGLVIEKALRKRLSGIAMPTYIVEIPNGGGKIPVISLTPEQRQLLVGIN